MYMYVDIDVCPNGLTIEVLVLSCERVSMGRVPYKSAKVGGGHSFKCFYHI